MPESSIYFSWTDRDVWKGFRTGVSLHSHTLHSKEGLDFIPRVARKIPPLHAAIERACRGRNIDFRRAWWTPPLTARQAWDTEKRQIEEGLGIEAMVSLTDHDNIEAALHLHVLEDCKAAPISVEWTILAAESFLHIGVHNLPTGPASVLWDRMRNDAANPGEMLRELAAFPEVLIVLNHPLWDEKGIGQDRHDRIVGDFLDTHAESIHALELNGMRPWAENQRVVRFARTRELPVVSGGDRHGREANACINLTAAASFAEFVNEIRQDQYSEVLFLSQYRSGLTVRVIQHLGEILCDDEGHGLGWRRWTDRIFYRCEDGNVRSLGELWVDGIPPLVSSFVALVGLVQHRPVRTALRAALAKDEVAL